LQVVTAILSDEEQLENHFQSRPGSNYDRNISPKWQQKNIRVHAPVATSKAEQEADWKADDGNNE